jgi:hypothetical protein
VPHLPLSNRLNDKTNIGATKRDGTPSKKYFESVTHLSALKKRLHRVHVYHAIHHNLTTKTPPLQTTFPKTPLKNIGKTTKTAPPPRHIFPVQK